MDKQFYDRTFNGRDDWFKLREDFVRRRKYDSKAEAFEAVGELLGKLDDPYTRFLPPDKFDSLVNSATATVAGVGVEILDLGSAAGGVVVGDVQPNSPAEKAGVMTGDRFKIVDGKDVVATEMTPEDVAGVLRGPPGSAVGVVFDRAVSGSSGKGGEREVLDLKLSRATIKIQTVTSRVLPVGQKRIGVIRVKAFSTSSADDIKVALKALTAAGGGENSGDGAANSNSNNLDAIALDLRNNAGGLLPGGIDSARLFLPKGSTIVSVTGAKGVTDTSLQDYEASIALPPTTPLFVLVNRKTASAAEVLTAALGQNGRAVVVGETTFGKGIVQNIVRLRDNTGVAVTTSAYLTPTGKSINKIGISPDRPLACEPLDSIESCLAGHEDVLAPSAPKVLLPLAGAAAADAGAAAEATT